MKFARNLLLSCVISAAGVASASAVDGVHQCTAQALGRTATVFLAVVSSPSGKTAWAPVNPSSTSGSWGYGIGTISGNAWSGTDESGNAFSLTISGTSFSGTVMNQSNGVTYAVSLSCQALAF